MKERIKSRKERRDRPEQESDAPAAVPDVAPVPDDKFSAAVRRLIGDAEHYRVDKGRQYDHRMRVSLALILLSVIGGGAGLFWFVVMDGNLRMAGFCVLAGAAVSILGGIWAQMPLHRYRQHFKKEFMPMLARAMGGMKYHPQGGIAWQAIVPAKVLPAHDRYTSEDCMTGRRGGIRFMLAEAKLYREKKSSGGFSGILVLLTTPQKKFRGHTIITSDAAMIRASQGTRWKALPETAPAAGLEAGPFRVFSNAPDEAVRLADRDLLEHLKGLSALFGGAAPTIVFYGGDKVFVMIPHDGDMFEPGDIRMPIRNGDLALKCKKEVEQILTVIDVIDVYEPEGGYPE